MKRVRDIFGNASFRGRLLLLLIVVSLIQVVAAAVTYNSLQSQPIEDRVQAQLAAGLQTAAPVLDDMFADAVSNLTTVVEDPSLSAAMYAQDTATVKLLVAQYDNPNLWVTDGSGQVIGGTELTVPHIDLADETDGTKLTLEGDSTLYGVVHMAVPFDEAFFAEVATFTDTQLFAADDTSLVTATVERNDGVVEGVELSEPVATPAELTASLPVATVRSEVAGVSLDEPSRPDELTEDLQEIELDGDAKYAYVRPVGGQDVMIGSAIPTDQVDALFDASRGKLIIFIALMLATSIVVSVLITKSVGGVMRAFAGGTRRVAEGQLDERLPVYGNDEVAVLSNSFNTMAENLQERMDNLIEARRRLRRQVEVFGEALANAHDIQEMLLAVCTIAIESTSATHARFWTIDEVGNFAHSACIGLRPRDRQPCDLEKYAFNRAQEMATHEAPYWLSLPVHLEDEVVGVLTLVSIEEPFSADNKQLAKRLATQAALALDNARMHEQLKMQATRDGLTGLPNHRSMQDTLAAMLSEAKEHSLPLGVAMLDVDNFKSVNDTHGHQVGDDALKMVAKALTSVVAEPAIVARYGGEEFCIVMPGMDSAASFALSDRARAEIERGEVPLPDGGVLKITASFGATNLENYARAPKKEAMLNDADVALYAAKHSGKNRVVLAEIDAEPAAAPAPAAETASGPDAAAA